MAVAVVVPSYNDTDLLKALIDSLFTTEPGEKFSVIVVDDGSPLLSHQKYLASLSESVTIARTQRGNYFTRAVNYGVTLARQNGFNKFFLLNSDCVVTDGWLSGALSAMVGDVGIVGSVLLNPDGLTAQHLGGYGEGYHFHIDQPWSCRKESRLVPWVTGAAMLIDNKVIEAIGFLPSSTPPKQYDFSDRNFCTRARMAGFEVAVAPASVIYHYTHVARIKRSSS